jgi:hypothetical protein
MVTAHMEALYLRVNLKPLGSSAVIYKSVIW